MSTLVKSLGILVLLAIIVANNKVTGLKFCGRDIPKMIIQSCGMIRKRGTETQVLGDLKNLAKRFYIDGLLRELWNEGKLLDSSGRPLNARAGSIASLDEHISMVTGVGKEQRELNDKKARLELLRDMLPGLIEMMQYTPHNVHEREAVKEQALATVKDNSEKFSDDLVRLLDQLGLSTSGSQQPTRADAVSDTTADVVKKDFDPLRNGGRLFHYMQSKRDGMAFVTLVDQCCRKGCTLNDLIGICDL